MKRYLLLILLAIGLVGQTLFAGNKDDDELLRRSKFFDPGINPGNTSFPRPFTELNNPISQAAVSTGYYFVDSDGEEGDFWRPNPEVIDTTEEPSTWKRIIAGPRILTGSNGTYRSYWTENPEEGLRFFRNPALPNFPSATRNFFLDLGNSDCFDCQTDSTDDAIAGPIPIGFPFYFNGLRFDSFYVSTNGIIALTNRRYTYDNQGNRVIKAGATDCYDPNSNDWFARSRIPGNDGGLSDPTSDDYGYEYSVCGGNPLSQYGGIRARTSSTSGSNSLSNLGNFAQVIAPFWADMELSQYDAVNKEIDDHGRVYYKRDYANNYLIIYFVNIAPVRTKYNHFGQAYSAPIDYRPGHSNYTSATAQVRLNRLDSSVTMVFERFTGNAVINGRGYAAKIIFRASTACGVRGFARHVNYGQSGSPQYPWAWYYEQATHYYNCLQNPNVIYPHNFLAIKFKQWKNTLRVVDIQYRIRSKDKDASLDFAPEGCRDCIVKTSEVNDYELLAGHDRIGAIQPVALVQNISNNIQGPTGVNFQPQQLTFRARFRIRNQATERIVYNRLVPVDSACLALPDSMTFDCTGDPNVKVRYVKVSKDGPDYQAEYYDPILPNNYNGIPPYGFVQVMFPPFEPNEFLPNHIGRLEAFIIADPTDPQTSDGYGDQWPFDDTTSVRLFVMKRLDEFDDDVTQYHVIGSNPMPSTLKWVNVEASVASGEQISFHPLPPRGQYSATNNPDFNLSTSEKDFTNFILESPVIAMNRYTLTGQDMSSGQSDYKGDQLRSFPIDLRNAHGAVLSLSFQRTNKKDDWPRGWSDQQLIGVEPRSYINADLLSWMGRYWKGGSYAWSAAASYYPDEIRVELMQPSPDGIQYITNVPDKRWRVHPRRGGLKPITTEPAYRLYGSNGYFTGFLEEDPDSALTQTNYNNLRGGYRSEMYDDGIDYEFRKAYIAIPDTFINSEQEGAKNFRFRIRVYASNDKKCLTCIPDDDDPFYVDNVKILLPSEITDIEVSSVKITWPYTMAPASQATSIPIRVKLSNNTSVPAPSFYLEVKIFKGWQTLDQMQAIYCRREPIPYMPARKEVEVPMPNWNAREYGDGNFRIVANIYLIGGDLEPLNDTTFTDIKLKYGDVFAYDPVQSPTNNVQDMEFAGRPGAGLRTTGYAFGGIGNIRYIQRGSYSELVHGTGEPGGDASGQIAVKFKLTMADTVKGFQAYFGSLNSSPDAIALSIYTDQNEQQPGGLIRSSQIYTLRGWDDNREDFFWNEYVTYKLASPVVLPAGTYWAVIAQLGQDGLELGASKSRMGMRTTNCFVQPIITQTKQIGQSGISLMIEKNFRKISTSGNNLINNNFFCIENTAGSGTWLQFMPTVGNPAYAHLDHFGTVDNGATATLSRGGWIPMLRPYLGNKSSGSKIGTYNPCPITPVELVSFRGVKKENGIDLMWETASEIDNYGFYVERRNITSDGDWQQIGFVRGSGSSSSANNYNYFDADVKLNTTYQYKIRQVDIDGSQYCSSSQIVTVTFDQVARLTLENNRPNPFAVSTTIGFNLPENSQVKLEILDIYGNVINTLVNADLDATFHSYNWNGTDQNGRRVANGTYIYRLTAGEDVLSGKMTYIK